MKVRNFVQLVIALGVISFAIIGCGKKEEAAPAATGTANTSTDQGKSGSAMGTAEMQPIDGAADNAASRVGSQVQTTGK